MPDSLNDIWSNVLYQKLILSTVVLLGAAGLRRFLGHLIMARVPDDSPHVYTLRKIMQYLVIALVAAVLLIIWVRQLGDLSVAFGILAAGLAFALQEVIGSIAGWVTIISGQPFTIGDRIETGGIRGDVVALMVLVSLAMTGLVTSAEALSGFANLAVVTVWAVLILCAGLARTVAPGRRNGSATYHVDHAPRRCTVGLHE